jgi:hypothetical protein
MKNSTTNRTHLYSVTVSNMSKDRFADIISFNLPTKYLKAFATADQIAQCQDAPICCETNAGSGEAYFVMDANLANALRKWFKRRFKGRSKFARQIVPTQFCACVSKGATA